MKLIKWLYFPLILFAIMVFEGCTATYPTTMESQLKGLKGIGPIRALTLDSTLYTFESFTYTDSLLSGTGTLERREERLPFKGSVPFRRIVFIERTEMSFWKPVWTLPMLAGYAAGISSLLSSQSVFEMSRPSGSSCPYVSSYDGHDFRLEAEAFGTSISKALEDQTYSVLPSLIPVDGLLEVRISNERPETHLINNVKLFAADAHEASSVVLDTKNLLWPVTHAVAPTAAFDHSGKNILGDVIAKDGRYWKSDLAHIAPFSGFCDQIEAQFNIPDNASVASLVIHAINTELISKVYQSIGAVLGNATMQFYFALEHDLQLQQNVREWIHDCSLAIEVETENGWREVDRIPPEATAVPFSRAIRIESSRSLHNSLHIRLSAMTDTWRIDAIAIDCSPAQPMQMIPLEMTTAIGSGGQDQRQALESPDSSYALVLPPQYIDIKFNSSPTRGMKKPVYVFAAQGYLYEWFPTTPAASSSLVSKATSGVDRVELLKLLIRHKDMFLPPIYALWQERARTEGR
jgi:hypothetical protein